MVEKPETIEVSSPTPAEVHNAWLDNSRELVERTWAFGMSSVWSAATSLQTAVHADEFPQFLNAANEVAQKVAAHGVDLNTLQEAGRVAIHNPYPTATILSAVAAVGFFGAGIVSNIRIELENRNRLDNE